VRNPKLITKFASALPTPARRLLDQLLPIAERRRVALFLVGGPLRDLLLERPSLDIDIAVEGDAPALARELAEATGGRAVTHPTFLTATVRIPGFHLDLITARTETYARPGALPTVTPAKIRDDLLRRDFTVNALALRLSGPEAGKILDPFGGLADLDSRLIRALHDCSFQDDATRILRAVRYAARLGFQIEAQTLAWIKRDIAYLHTISGARLHHEFARILEEDTPEETLLSLHEYGALAVIQPALSFAPEHAAGFSRLRELHPTGARAAYWPVFAWRLTEAEAADLGRRLALTKPQHSSVEAMPALQAIEPALTVSGSRRDAPQARLGAAGGRTQRPPLKRSTLVELLSPFPLPALWAFAALAADITVRNRLLDYLTKARHERPHLTGGDLLALGVPPSPAVGDILRRLRDARLDGEVQTRTDEKRLVSKLVAAAPSGLPPRPGGLTTPLAAHPEVSKE